MGEREILISQNDFRISDYKFFVLSADVGGSHTYVAVMGVRSKKKYDMILKYSYKTSEVAVFHEVLNKALQDAHEMFHIGINRCCIGGAGPVSRKRGYIKLTNHDLEINQKEILAHTMLNKVILINDFEAVGYGLDMLDLVEHTYELDHVGEDLTHHWTPGNTYAVIGAGTGLGMSIVHYDLGKHLHIPLPSEGGHMDFVPYNHLEMELVEYLKKNKLTKKDVHPEYERVLCGTGVAILYEFLRSKQMFGETEITKKIDDMSEEEKPQEIFNNYKNDETCAKVVDMFINFYARAARILALIAECYSGLFIAGKIAIRNPELFGTGKFMEEFEKHDKRNDVLRKTKVYIVKNEDAGLLGCCNVAANFYNI